MSRIYIVCAVITFLINASLAQWQFSEIDGQQKAAYFTSISYTSLNEGFATGISRAIFHTQNNWETYERIESNIPPEQLAHYIEMSSKTNGILVTRKEYIGFKDRFYVWTTSNGGYNWTLVFTSPKLNSNPPNTSMRLDYEKVLVKGFGDNLFVLLGEVMAFGNKNGSNWTFQFTGVNRRHLNHDLEVFGNEIWRYMASSDQFSNFNQSYEILRDFPGTVYVPFLIGMDNKLQGILDSVIYEKNQEAGKWERLSELPNVGTIQKVVQLSKMLTLFEYSTPSSGVKYSVYNRQNKQWTNLNSKPEFLFEKDLILTFYGTTCYRLERSNVIWVSKDYGVTWSIQATIKDGYRFMEHYSPHVTFSGNLGIIPVFSNWVSSNTAILTYSVDSGVTWMSLSYKEFHELVGDSLIQGLLCSYDLDKKLYVFYGTRVFEVSNQGQKLKLAETAFTYNGIKISPLDICNDGMNCYVLADISTKVNTKNYAFLQANNGELSMVYNIGVHNQYYNQRVPRIIQSDDYVAFSVGDYLYGHDKRENATVLISDSLVNGLKSFKFYGATIKYLCNFNTGFYDFKSKNNNVISYDFEHGLNYGFLIAGAFGKSKDLWSAGGFIYATNDWQEHSKDTNYYPEGQTYNIRFWNDKFWTLTNHGIYRQIQPINQSYISLENYWPNPVSDQLELCFKSEIVGQFDYSIINNVGQQMSSGFFHINVGVTTEKIDFTQMAHGMYYLKIENEAFNKSYKIIRN